MHGFVDTDLDNANFVVHDMTAEDDFKTSHHPLCKLCNASSVHVLYTGRSYIHTAVNFTV